VIYTEYVSPLSVSYGHTKMEVQHYKRPSAESQKVPAVKAVLEYRH
jgi:hypothetical protein